MRKVFLSKKSQEWFERRMKVLHELIEEDLARLDQKVEEAEGERERKTAEFLRAMKKANWEVIRAEGIWRGVWQDWDECWEKLERAGKRGASEKRISVLKTMYHQLEEEEERTRKRVREARAKAEECLENWLDELRANQDREED